MAAPRLAVIVAILGAGLLGAAVGGLAGCSGVASPAATAIEVFSAQDGSFAFRYVAPPWSPTKIEPSSIELEITAEAFGVSFEDSPPTHMLVAGQVDISSGFDGLLESVGIAADELDTDGFDTDGFDTDGFDTDGFDPGDLPDEAGTDGEDLPELPDYLLDVDLDNPRDVAFAELAYLLDEENARIVSGVHLFRTERGLEGVEYQVAMDPGIFVRSFYFPTRGRTLRVGFVSLFDLETSDIELMMQSFRTDLVGGGA